MGIGHLYPLYRFNLQGEKVLIMRTREQHRKRYTPEYYSWRNMKTRCYNKNNPNFKYCGARGITVCSEWIDSFESFFEDMGTKPFPRAEIDRRDNDGNYNKDNCRWVTSAQNCQNKSNNKLTIEKVREIRKAYPSKTQTALSLEYNVSASNINYIVNN